jgi:hypothetical protein
MVSGLAQQRQIASIDVRPPTAAHVVAVTLVYMLTS